MGSDIDRNDGVFPDEQLECDSIADVDGHGVEIIEFARELVEPERRVSGIELKQAKGLLILTEQIRVTLDEALSPANVGLGVDNLRHW